MKKLYIGSKLIKNCPFCGGSGEEVEYMNTSGYWVYYVQCNNCHVKGPHVTLNKTESLEKHDRAKTLALYAWDNRV